VRLSVRGGESEVECGAVRVRLSVRGRVRLSVRGGEGEGG